MTYVVIIFVQSTHLFVSLTLHFCSMLNCILFLSECFFSMFHSDPFVETKQHQNAQPPIKILVLLHIYIYIVCVCVHMHADVMCVVCTVYYIYLCTHTHTDYEISV